MWSNRESDSTIQFSCGTLLYLRMVPHSYLVEHLNIGLVYARSDVYKIKSLYILQPTPSLNFIMKNTSEQWVSGVPMPVGTHPVSNSPTPDRVERRSNQASTS